MTVNIGPYIAGPGGRELSIVGGEAFAHKYRSWSAADGLAAKVGASVTGAGNFVAALGLPRAWATALMAVLVASFAGTTLDTAVRLQRYVVEELWTTVRRRGGESPFPESRDREGAGGGTSEESGPPPRDAESTAESTAAASAVGRTGPLPHGRGSLRTRVPAYAATLVAVVTGGLLAAIPASGQWNLQNVGTGGLILWPLFGASNQLLAGLAFAVILFYLRRRRVMTWFLIPPMLFMLVMPAWAMMSELPTWWKGGRYVLAGIGFLCLALETWMVVEAALLYGRVKGVAEGTGERRGFEVLVG